MEYGYRLLLGGELANHQPPLFDPAPADHQQQAGPKPSAHLDAIRGFVAVEDESVTSNAALNAVGRQESVSIGQKDMCCVRCVNATLKGVRTVLPVRSKARANKAVVSIAVSPSGA